MNYLSVHQHLQQEREEGEGDFTPIYNSLQNKHYNHNIYTFRIVLCPTCENPEKGFPDT